MQPQQTPAGNLIKVWNQVHQQLVKSLVAAFDYSDFKRMLEYNCDKRLQEVKLVAPDDNLFDVVEAVVRDAEYEGWVPLLLEGAIGERPQQRQLKAVAHEFEQLSGEHGDRFYQKLLPPRETLAEQPIIIGDVGDSAMIAIGEGARIEKRTVTLSGGQYVENQTIVMQPQQPEKPRLPFEPDTILIPAGAFVMGDDAVAHAAPQHVVDLPAFRIALYPVTNIQFAKFIRDTGGVAAKELLWNGNQPPAQAHDLPVSGVTWFEALAYCAWISEQSGRSYTLPNEAQWEKAVRGTDARRYPWGDQWQPQRCNDERGSNVPVDAYPAQSPFGCFDMVGNAPEWTRSLWGAAYRTPDANYAYPWRPDERNYLDGPDTVLRVVRGGSGRTPEEFGCARRRAYAPAERGPRTRRIGFRIVQEEQE